MTSRIVVAGCVAALLIGVVAARADETGFQPAQPQKEHEWLRQLVGEWESEVECAVDPAKPPQKTKGTESGRLVGELWVVLENRGEFMGRPFTGVLTLGYDPERKKFIGTWCDSMSTHLWQYEGTLDASGKILTLESEGPCPTGGQVRVRETIEIEGRDHKVFTSKVEIDGKWQTGMTIQYRRKS